MSDVPVDWCAASLEDHWFVIDCKHITAKFVAQGFPVISIGELQHRFVEFRHAPRTTRYFYRLLTQPPRKPRAGDLIMSRNATVGRVAQVCSTHPPFAMGQDVCTLRSRNESQSVDYFQYLLQSPHTTRQIANFMAGSTFKRLNIQQIKKLQVIRPPTAEQERIADALLDADSLIATLERLMVKKQAIKQGLMQQLISGRTRLPGFTAQWSCEALSSVATVKMGQSPVGSSYNTSGRGVPLVQGNADIGHRRTIERIWTTAPTKRCRRGDVVLTVRAPVGYTSLAASDVCLGRGVCSIAAGQDNRYLYHALVYAEPRWAVYEQGSTFTAVNTNEVRAFTVPWPGDQKERKAIGEVLDDADAEIRLLQERLVKVQEIKQGMMQELLTGRTRLPVAEDAA